MDLKNNTASLKEGSEEQSLVQVNRSLIGTVQAFNCTEMNSCDPCEGDKLRLRPCKKLHPELQPGF